MRAAVDPDVMAANVRYLTDRAVALGLKVAAVTAVGGTASVVLGHGTTDAQASEYLERIGVDDYAVTDYPSRPRSIVQRCADGYVRPAASPERVQLVVWWILPERAPDPVGPPATVTVLDVATAPMCLAELDAGRDGSDDEADGEHVHDALCAPAAAELEAAREQDDPTDPTSVTAVLRELDGYRRHVALRIGGAR